MYTIKYIFIILLQFSTLTSFCIHMNPNIHKFSKYCIRSGKYSLIISHSKAENYDLIKKESRSRISCLLKTNSQTLPYTKSNKFYGSKKNYMQLSNEVYIENEEADILEGEKLFNKNMQRIKQFYETNGCAPRSSQLWGDKKDNRTDEEIQCYQLAEKNLQDVLCEGKEIHCDESSGMFFNLILREGKSRGVKISKAIPWIFELDYDHEFKFMVKAIKKFYLEHDSYPKKGGKRMVLVNSEKNYNETRFYMKEKRLSRFVNMNIRVLKKNNTNDTENKATEAKKRIAYVNETLPNFSWEGNNHKNKVSIEDQILSLQKHIIENNGFYPKSSDKNRTMYHILTRWHYHNYRGWMQKAHKEKIEKGLPGYQVDIYPGFRDDLVINKEEFEKMLLVIKQHNESIKKK